MDVQGIHVPLITPFGEDGRVDGAVLERLARGLLDDGVAGLVALGTTAEAAALDEGERAAVRGIVGRVCRERGAHFTVGAGSNDTRRTEAEVAGLEADAALVTVPYFTRPSEAGVVAHFERVAAASAAPLIVYNVPYRTGQTLSRATVRALAAIPGVIGFKHAVGGIDADTVALVGEVPLYAGDDVFAPALFAMGAPGGILASAHLGTGRWVELFRAYEPGLGHELSAMAATLFAEPNPTVIKAVLHAQGRIPTPAVRLPLLAAGGPARETAVRALAAAGDTRDRTYALIGETGQTR
jgi:4-hydroxy-tetrahydrodipicolinate synthase